MAATDGIRIRGMTARDWPEVSRIWAAGIASGDAAFELAPPSWPAFDASRAPHLRLVAEPIEPMPIEPMPIEPMPIEPLGSGRLLGWAAAGPVSSRRVYSGVAEHSVYVDPDCRGAGVGQSLLEALIVAAEATGTWMLRSGIFPENASSLRLHDRCGFRRLGIQERVGVRDGRWRDVVLTERRSQRIGDRDPLVRVILPYADEAAAVRGLLTAADLPLAGLDDAWRIWVADAGATTGPIVATAALERHLDAFLLRSIAVDPAQRGRGLGQALVRAALTCADLELGEPATVCLLTTTADGWFDRFGFLPVQRDDLPVAVFGSAELSGACPESARAYLRAG